METLDGTIVLYRGFNFLLMDAKNPPILPAYLQVILISRGSSYS